MTYTDSTGVLSISNGGTVIPQATLETILQGIQYNDTSDNPNVTARTVNVIVSDGTGTSPTRIATIDITRVNDAPVLTAASPLLTAITENDTANAGQSVSSFRGAVADPDSPSLGIAINAATFSNGQWEYSLDAGAHWTAFPAVTDSAALLLRDSDLVRFVPDAQNGSTDTFTYHAWDRSTGTAGSTGDVGTTGGTTAFSAVADTATITVSSVNDAPVLTPASPTLTAITENDTVNAGQTVASFTSADITDVDTGALQGIAITATADGNGHWEFSLNGTSWSNVGAVSGSSALLLRSSDFIRFIPDGKNGTTGKEQPTRLRV